MGSGSHTGGTEGGFSPEELALDMITGLKGELGTDAAHAKLLLATGTGSLKTSPAGGRVQADSALEPGVLVPRAGLTLNIRALRSPEELEADSPPGLSIPETGFPG